MPGEYATPETVKLISDIGVVLGVVLAFGGAAVAFLRWSHKQLTRQITTVIEDRTRQVQPGYRNAGESLADVSHRVQRIETRLDEMRHAQVQWVAQFARRMDQSDERRGEILDAYDKRAAEWVDALAREGVAIDPHLADPPAEASSA